MSRSRDMLTGTGSLIRLAIRRDRFKLGAWLVGLSLGLLSINLTYMDFYSTEQELVEMILVRASSPVMRIFDTPASGISMGAFIMMETYTFMAILVALMSSQTVIRHTRQNEETGRSEMIGSAVVGRYAPLTAAWSVAVGSGVLLAVLLFLALIASGLPAVGSLAAAAGYGGIALTFASIAAVTAQLSESSRGANGLAGAAVGLSFLLSSAGNILGRVQESGMRVESSWIAWLSPIGWGGQIRAYHDNNVAVLSLFVAASIVLAILAFRLASSRDMGAGLLPQKRGASNAHPALLTPFGLAWRLQRSTWIGWAVSVALLGSAFGAISIDFESMLANNERMSELLVMIGGTAAFTDTYFAVTLSMIGSILAVYPVQSVLRMRSEEAGGTLEPVLAAAVNRYHWKSSFVACAATGTLLLLIILGLSTGVVAALATGELQRIYELPAAALLQLAPLWLLAGVSCFAFGLAPRLSSGLAWTGFTVSLLLSPMLADLFRLPQWARNLSPFSHVSAYPAEAIELAPLLWMLAAAIILTAIGLLLFRRRDLSL